MIRVKHWLETVKCCYIAANQIIPQQQFRNGEVVPGWLWIANLTPLRERYPLMLLKCVFLFTFLPTVPCFRGVPDFRTEQVRGGFTFLLVLFLVACESIRFFRLKFLRVKLETWAEKTGCSRRLSFRLPDRFPSVNYATPVPHPPA